jgi:hypothetical protein
MENINFKLEFITILIDLEKNIFNINICGDILSNFNNINNISTKTLLLLHNFYSNIEKLYILTNTYTFDDFKNINYKCINLNTKEHEYITNNLNNNIRKYNDEFSFFEHNCINRFDKLINDYNNSKFYGNTKHKITNSEIMSSIILNYIFETTINITERETFGYLIKVILNEYDYSLCRNALFVGYDISEYNEMIRGKIKFVNTFDEDEYDYTIKIVNNIYYNDENTFEPIEKFEKHFNFYNSKYNELQNIIAIKLKKI